MVSARRVRRPRTTEEREREGEPHIKPHGDPTFRDVEVEEVAVENGLNNARDDRDPVEEVLRMITVDPIENVEESIDAQRKEIMAGDRFRLASSADHVQLRKDRHGFEIDGKCPENLEDEARCAFALG